jgi:hypothetical protein
MEGDRMIDEAPIGQVWKWKKAWKEVLMMKGGCQSVVSSLYTPTNVEKSPTHLVCP